MGLAKELLSRCEELIRRQGEHLPKQWFLGPHVPIIGASFLHLMARHHFLIKGVVVGHQIRRRRDVLSHGPISPRNNSLGGQTGREESTFAPFLLSAGAGRPFAQPVV